MQVPRKEIECLTEGIDGGVDGHFAAAGDVKAGDEVIFLPCLAPSGAHKREGFADFDESFGVDGSAAKLLI